MNQRIDRFDDEFSFLSNFYPADVVYNGWPYPTVEHAYQASKAEHETDRQRISRCLTAGQAKRLGKTVLKKHGWDNQKLDIMRTLLEQKFACDPLRAALLDTGDAELIEGNWWGDIYWGVCNGVGSNNLGKLLMEVRTKIKEATK
jgi:ribA/ribD-fused uncharacterized protein